MIDWPVPAPSLGTHDVTTFQEKYQIFRVVPKRLFSYPGELSRLSYICVRIQAVRQMRVPYAVVLLC